MTPGRPSFGDTLAARVAERQSQIVLGLDPDPAALWPQAAAAADAAADGSAGARAAAAVLAHCRAVIDAAADACVAVKLQLARFEALGPRGGGVARATADHARERGLLVIADGKRGDIDVSAGAYAAALFAGMDTAYGHVPGLDADAATVNPLLGRDSLEPFVSAARAAGAGLFVLVRTSNPGAADIEDLELAGGGAVWERVAAIVTDLASATGPGGGPGAAGGPGGVAGAGGQTGERGLDDIGAVMGATAPEHLARARELMPRAPLLLPGIGAQGGRVGDLQAAFAPGPAGGLVTASRSIAGAHTAGGGEPAAAARAEAERLREAAWTLAGGLAGAV